MSRETRAMQDDDTANPGMLWVLEGGTLWEKKTGAAGRVIPQAHPTGYPLYRLEWQNLGSLQRRLRNCLVGIRAEPYDYGAPELVDLELYLMWRARGMTMDAPAVRP